MEEFVVRQRELLKEDHQAEIEECAGLLKSLPVSELQNRGICIKKLHITSMKTGLYGRTVVKLCLRGAPDRPLPSNNFSSGDIVDIHLKTSADLSKAEIQGVVTSVKDSAITVALDGDDARSKADELHSHSTSLLLLKSANEVTYRRLQKGLDQLLHHNRVASNLVNICFGDTKPSSYDTVQPVTKFYNDNLNDSQREAINFALSQRDIAVIHGPPGTGKTTTIAELISQLASNGQKVLACAPSNVAIDNILEKLSGATIERYHEKGGKSKIQVIRLGHPARILTPELQSLSLDAMISKSEAAKIVQDVRKDIDNLHLRFRKRHNKTEQGKLREEKKLLMQELRSREKKAISEILLSADVILATNVGAHIDSPLKYLPKDHFQVTVIDECGQALEASCWIPIQHAPKVILAGDHLQLPPTVKSHTAAAKGLSKSLLERIVESHAETVRMLNTQYRMNSSIMNWSSQELYGSKLKAHSSVFDHTLAQLRDVDETEDTNLPLLLIDTAGCNMPELQTIDSESIGNPGEAEIVAHHVESLIQAGVAATDIAVISPYNMQVDILRKMLLQKFSKLEIRSIDGFQGREKEAVIISLVRSNEKGVVGFLSDDRRMNVAVTRARRHLALVCDSDTVGRHKFLRTLLDYMTKNGDVRSGYEFSQYCTSEFDASKYIQLGPKREPLKNLKSAKLKDPLDLSKVKIKFRKTIEQFLNQAHQDGPKCYKFSKSLSGRERLVIHELCEELGIQHQSVGEGEDRRIIVSANEILTTKIATASTDSKIIAPLKTSQEQCITDVEYDKVDAQSSIFDGTEGLSGKEDDEKINPMSGEKIQEVGTNSDEIVEGQPASQEFSEAIAKITSPLMKNITDKGQEPNEEESCDAVDTKKQNTYTCEVCGRTIPVANTHLHAIHCQKLHAMKEKLASKQTESKNRKPKKKPAKAKDKKRSSPGDTSKAKDDDELLNEAILANKSCSIGGCERRVSMLGQACPYCKKTHCLEHHLPELHGCGVAAHSAARRQICRDGILYGGATSSKKLPPTKHANLQRKLDNKLKEMENKRKPNQRKK